MKPVISGVPQAVLQTVLLLLLTVLVCVFYERGRQSDLALAHLETWSVTAVPCEVGEEDCMECRGGTAAAKKAASCPFAEEYLFYTHEGPTSLCNLVGQAPEYERRVLASMDGLFAGVSVPFLLLVAQLISTAFYMGYVRQEDAVEPVSPHHSNNLQKTIKRISLVVQFIFAGNSRLRFLAFTG